MYLIFFGQKAIQNSILGSVVITDDSQEIFLSPFFCIQKSFGV
jgi:hypothetical protein